MPNTLDAIALSSLPEPALINRIAALWCRANKNSPPYNATEVIRWIKREFGPLISGPQRDRLAKALVGEINRQVRVRRRRGKVDIEIDPLTLPLGADLRLGLLLQSRLGPARRWVSKYRMHGRTTDCAYIDGDFYSGLIAGLVPVQMRLRRIVDPNLLVYRSKSSDPMVVFVPTFITTVRDAFRWLIPPEAAEFMRLPDCRVEHLSDDQAVRLVTPFGVKVLPWRSLTPE